MSDDRLRAFEREWERSGALEDGVVYLRYGLRIGVLDLPRARLAAYLGDATARALLAEEGEPARAPLELLDEATVGEALRWAEALAGFGEEAARRCGLALARPALPEWERHSERLTPRWRNPGARGRPRLDPRPGELLASLEAWARDPTRRTLADLDRAWASCEEVTFLRAQSWRARAALAAVQALLRASRADPVGVVRAVFDLLRPSPGLTIRTALRAEVLPWALYRGDALGVSG